MSSEREVRPVSGFNRLSFRGVGNVILSQGDQESLEIEAREEIRPRIITEVRDGTLIISYHHDWLDWVERLGNLFFSMVPIRYHVTMKDIAGISSSGAGNIDAAQITAGRLELALSGAGNISIGTLNAQSLVARLSGLGNVEVAGQVGEQEVTLSGAGNYHAGRLESRIAGVRLNGVGNATVWVRDDLDASLSGVGNVEYFGRPHCKSNVHGLGNLRGLGDR